MLAAAYLFWLCISHLIERNGVDDDGNSSVVMPGNAIWFKRLFCLG